MSLFQPTQVDTSKTAGLVISPSRLYPQLASLRPIIESSCSLPPTHVLQPTPVLQSIPVLQPTPILQSTHLLLLPTPGLIPPTICLLPLTPVLRPALVLQPTHFLNPPPPGNLPSPLALIQLSLSLLPLSPLILASPGTNQVTALLPYASEERKDARRKREEVENLCGRLWR